MAVATALVLLQPAALAQGTARGEVVETSTGPYTVGSTFTLQLRIAANPGDQGLGTSSIVLDFNSAFATLAASPADGVDYTYQNYNGAQTSYQGAFVAYNSTLVRTNPDRLTVNIELGFTGDDNGQALPDVLTDVIAINFTVADPNATRSFTFKTVQLFNVTPPGQPGERYTNGTFTGLVESTLSQSITGTEGWRMLAAPLATATFDDLLDGLWTQGFPGSDYNENSPAATPNVYRYDETVAGDADQGFAAPGNQADEVGSGLGFIVYVFSDDDFDGTPEGFPKTLSLIGAAPSGTVNPAVSYTDNGPTDQDEGWQLFGNPFEEPIDWDLLTKSGFDATVYVWDPASSAYRVWDGSAGDLTDGIITPFQGFLARAQSGAATFSVPQSAKTTGGTFYGFAEERPSDAARSEDAASTREGDAPTLPLVLETPQGTARAWVRVRDAAEVDYDGLDAYALGPLAATYAQLYTLPLDTEAEAAVGLVINALPSLEPSESHTVALDLRAVEAGKTVGGRFTLGWPALDAVPEGWTLELRDAQTATTVDLRATGAYTFDWTPTPGTTPSEEEPQAATTALLQLGGLLTRRQAIERFTLTITNATGVSAEEGTGVLPEAVVLAGNYPNPFTARTTLDFGLHQAGAVRLIVHDVLGRQVALLLDDTRSAGWHSISFDASGLASGVYVARLDAQGQTASLRMLVLR